MKGILAAPFLALGLTVPADTVLYGEYNEDLVAFETITMNKTDLHVVSLNLKDSRVKVKYFPTIKEDQSIEQQFEEWGKGKNVILYTSAAYMSGLGASNAGTVGFTVDEGDIINDKFTEHKMDAMVLVDQYGHVQVQDMSQKYIEFNSIDGEAKFDMSNAMHIERFRDFAIENKFTVFQTHLLAKDGELMVYEKEKPKICERRFHALATDSTGQEFNYIIHVPTESSMFVSAGKVKEYLDQRGFVLNSLINLDTGAQDVISFYDAKGSKNEELVGRLDITQTSNLMVYYYE